jgi:hypothetical protein
MKLTYTLMWAILLGGCGTEGEKKSTDPTPTPEIQVVKGPKGDSGKDGQSVQGPKGDTGKAGANSVVSLIAPCGVASSPWKEQIMCLTTGQLLASFSQNSAGQNTRFSLIGTGDYEDTDESGCNFHVDVDDLGNSTVSWKAGSNTYSTWQDMSQTCINLEGVTNGK